MSGLCGDMAYYATMTKNCPATCNRCGCEDVSDSCSNMSSLCGSALYYKILKQKCPVTCGYCE